MHYLDITLIFVNKKYIILIIEETNITLIHNTTLAKMIIYVHNQGALIINNNIFLVIKSNKKFCYLKALSLKTIN